MSSSLKQMTKSYQQWVNRINGIAVRERLLLLLSLLLVVYVVWFFMLMLPLKRVISSTKTQSDVLTKEVAQLQLQKQNILNQIQALEQAKTKVGAALTGEALDATFKSWAPYLVTVKKTLDILKSALDNEGAFTIQQVINLPDKPLVFVAGGAPMQPLQLYEQGVILVFEGDYEHTFQYLKKIEDMKFPLFWDDFSYEVDKYPMAKVKIRIHTYSLTKED